MNKVTKKTLCKELEKAKKATEFRSSKQIFYNSVENC